MRSPEPHFYTKEDIFQFLIEKIYFAPPQYRKGLEAIELESQVPVLCSLAKKGGRIFKPLICLSVLKQSVKRLWKRSELDCLVWVARSSDRLLDTG